MGSAHTDGLASELEPDPARKERHDELVEAHALGGGLGDELTVKAGGHANENAAAGVHAPNDSACAIDMRDSACDTARMSITSPEPISYIAFGDRNIHDGFRIDGSKVRFWATKKMAADGAKSIGWPMDSLTKVHTRFCGGWALADGRFGFLSKDSFAALYHDRMNGGE